jgi:hypothetical protein
MNNFMNWLRKLWCAIFGCPEPSVTPTPTPSKTPIITPSTSHNIAPTLTPTPLPSITPTPTISHICNLTVVVDVIN